MNTSLRLTAVSLSVTGTVMILSATPALAATAPATFGTCQSRSSAPSVTAPGTSNIGPVVIHTNDLDQVTRVSGPLASSRFVYLTACS
jgi:hypothetical protein